MEQLVQANLRVASQEEELRQNKMAMKNHELGIATMEIELSEL